MTPSEKTIYFATFNDHKIKEIGEILDGYPIKLLSLASLSCSDNWKESGSTYLENAEIKAKFIRQYTAYSILAEDSGLSVEALNGNPGVYSKRFSGINATDKKNNDLLLNLLKGSENRKAKFCCQAVYLGKTGNIKSFYGEVLGKISLKVQGENGFGYDPVFIPDGYDKTFGELSSEVKNNLSHRKNAMIQFKNWLASNNYQI